MNVRATIGKIENKFKIEKNQDLIFLKSNKIHYL